MAFLCWLALIMVLCEQLSLWCHLLIVGDSEVQKTGMLRIPLSEFTTKSKTQSQSSESLSSTLSVRSELGLWTMWEGSDVEERVVSRVSKRKALLG